MELTINIALLTLLVLTGLLIARTTSLFAAVMLFGIYSLLIASIFVVLDAVDVAFTEAAVGTCIATILMLSALSLTGSRKEHAYKRNPIIAASIVGFLGVALFWGLSDIPYFGDPSAPASQHIMPYYLNQSPHEIGIPNVVTSVLASYRGYDTLGEVVVIFTAGVGVISLLASRRKNDKK